MAPSVEVMNHHHHGPGHHRHPHHHGLEDLDASTSRDESEVDISHSSTNGDDPLAASSRSNTTTEAAAANENSANQEDDWQNVTKPGQHDVLLGRGGGTNNHSGNIKFRKLVNEHKMRYLACSKVDKPKVARDVVQLWRKLTPPGRFLARKDDSRKGPGSVKAADNVWYEVGDKKAREKASQCLRERTPDVMPYIKQLREQQDAMTEHGVSLVQQQMQMQQHGDSMVGPFPRRNSMPVPPHHHHAPGMQMSPSGGQLGPNPAMLHRRTSAPTLGAPPQPYMNHPAGAPPMNDGYVEQQPCFPDDQQQPQDFYADMTDMEYEHLMRMQQQQLQMQHVALQRMRQQRLGMRRGSGMQQGNNNNNGPMSPNNGNGNTFSPQPQGQGSMPGFHNNNNNSHPQQQVAHPPSGHGEPLGVHQDPLLNMSPSNKRTRDDNNSAAAPDTAPSNVAATPAPPDESGELTLDTYRQQLEEYLNRQEEDDEDGGDLSDLEDDWEKERERARKQEEPKRGVDRNASAMSYMKQDEPKRGVDRNASAMSYMTEGGLSMVSGMSMFSDLSLGLREQKMNMARSVGSNLTLMSDMTDLSQNIDNLSLLDD